MTAQPCSVCHVRVRHTLQTNCTVLQGTNNAKPPSIPVSQNHAPGRICCYSSPMAEQAVWQTSKSKLDGYKGNQFGLHALREKEVWQGFSLQGLPSISDKDATVSPHQMMVKDVRMSSDQIALVMQSLWTSRWVKSVCKGTPHPDVISTSFPLSLPITVDKFIVGKRWMHKTDLLSQPGMTSWGSELMLNIIVDGSCCQASLFQGFLFPAVLLGHSSQSPLFIAILDTLRLNKSEASRGWGWRQEGITKY